ncbi:DNA internalization-related competence protein ComEC/Rec2 [Arthrobacter sp. MYb227]|nr:DNA internalization-related competence protein ComEC/Rec2 [Arthrobacter sp. MYb227]
MAVLEKLPGHDRIPKTLIKKLTSLSVLPSEASIAPLRLDLRGLWSLIGAWSAALLGVRIEQTRQATLAVGCLILAGIAVMLLLRKRHGVLGTQSTPLFAAPALMCAAAGLVLVHMLLSGATLLPNQLSSTLQKSDVARVQLVLEQTPQQGTVIDKFSEGAQEKISYRAQATLKMIKVGDTWVRLNVHVVLNYPQEKAPTVAPPLRDSTIEVLARFQATPVGQRNRFRLTAITPVRLIDEQKPASLDARLRSTFIRAAQVLPDPGRALLPGMVFGDRSGQSQELGDAMKASGLSHLSAVSGANCAMVLGVVTLLLRFAGVPRSATFICGLAALAGFVMLVGFEPSVLRAAVMGGIAAFAVHSSRGRNALSALCLAVVILLVADPYLAGEAAFQLSALATAGIVMIGRKLAVSLKRRLPEFLAEGIAIALAAQIACLPVLVSLSPTFSLYSVPANLLVAPLIPWITITGTAAVILLSLLPPLGMALLWAGGIPATWVGSMGMWVAALPGALRPWPVGVVGLALAWGIFIAVFFSLGYAPGREGTWHAKLPSGVQALTVGLLMGLTLPVTALFPMPRVDWLIVACDVGQGDGIVINTGDGRAIVIDTGREPQDIDACLQRLRVNEIAALFITHQHADHDGGIAGVGTKRRVAAIYYSILDAPASPPILQGHRGTQLAAGAHGETGNVSWRVIAPAGGDAMSDENDASLVTRFEIKIPGTERTISFLETGDMQEVPMGELLAHGKIQPADILKIAHHGARNGGTEIIGRVRPVVALISVGKSNTYGHPSPQIIRALENAQIPALRTDEHGSIVLGWEHDRLSISTLSTRQVKQ